MTLGGYANRIARINLTSLHGEEYDQVPKELLRHCICTARLGVKFVFDNGPKVDPLCTRTT